MRWNLQGAAEVAELLQVDSESRGGTIKLLGAASAMTCLSARP
jgi:hypothetical protein